MFCLFSLFVCMFIISLFVIFGNKRPYLGGFMAEIVWKRAQSSLSTIYKGFYSSNINWKCWFCKPSNTFLASFDTFAYHWHSASANCSLNQQTKCSRPVCGHHCENNLKLLCSAKNKEDSGKRITYLEATPWRNEHTSHHIRILLQTLYNGEKH